MDYIRGEPLYGGKSCRRRQVTSVPSRCQLTCRAAMTFVALLACRGRNFAFRGCRGSSCAFRGCRGSCVRYIVHMRKFGLTFSIASLRRDECITGVGKT